MPRWFDNWMERHRNRTSLWLHVVGIPLVIAALVLAAVQLWQWRWDLWWRPAALFVPGYLLQWIGHRIEGNDMGEVILIKKLLGRPYVALSDQSASSRKSACASRAGSGGPLAPSAPNQSGASSKSPS